MKNNVRTVALFVLLGSVLLSAIVTAQIAFLHPVQLQDVQKNGVNLKYFDKQPSVHKWNITGVAQPSISGYTMTIPEPVQSSADMKSGSGCSAATRGTFSVLENPSTTDGGAKDLTYQCCYAQGGTYVWIAGYCQ